MFILSLLVIWAMCGAFAYGITFGHFQRKWPSLADKEVAEDKMVAIVMAVCGPIGLIASYILSERVKYGLKF